MKESLYKFTCDQCGASIVLGIVDECEPDYPEGWAHIVNDDYPSDGKEFHFSSYDCYKQYEKLNPDAISNNASFYYLGDWWKA